ncbi:MAG: addiction module protein [Gemmataceae bacterium]|nr:addiction module protein [Gemmataceae bacterium]
MPGAAAEFPIESLTVDERLELIDRLWESLDAPSVPDWHRAILRQRVAESDANPGAGLSLDELRRELKGPKP